MTEIFKIISQQISYTEPTKSFILCGIYTIMILLSVIIIGAVFDIIEVYQIRILRKLFGGKVASFICNRLTFPGIVVHELSHAVFASMLGASVTKIKLISLRNDGRLGYVEYITRGRKMMQGLQHAWSSCAPTIVGMILEYALFSMFHVAASLPQKLIIIYFIISIADHMSMSKQDIMNYIRGSWAIAAILYIVLLILRLN